ncbi:hypothetical protein F4776DRAFT_675641 [Hypoxylon sp. NC0597]|nr:hypothetical protein F4776DRAFT_675641 [Hypoxylon sp. NC0597]
MSTPSNSTNTGVGDARDLEVEVDSVKTIVTQFRFAPMAYFLHSPATPQETWRDICSKPMQSIWVYAFPLVDEGPNTWKLALELDGGKIVTLELYNTKTRSGTVFLVRSLTEDVDGNTSDDYRNLMRIKVTCAGRRMQDNITLRDIILKVHGANLLKYQLSEGRGYRFWVHVILKEIEPLIREFPRGARLCDEATEIMRSRWTDDGRRTGRPGYEDEPDNPLNIVAGVWPRISADGEEMERSV